MIQYKSDTLLLSMHGHISDFSIVFADKTAALDDTADAGAEMTEEEWNLRVAELNKHQVRVCKKKQIQSGSLCMQ